MKPRHGAPILLLLAACVGVVTHARAQLGQELWQLGDELAALAGSGAGQSSVTLNGAQIELVTLTIPGPVKLVLDRFDALCAREAPALTADVSGHGSLLRQESSTGGVAVCLAVLAMAAGPASADDFIGGWQKKYPTVKYGVIPVETQSQTTKSMDAFLAAMG